MSGTIYKKSNQRIKTTLVALICALVFVGSMVIGIFAATQQNVTSNFSVIYEVGENVAVKVRTESYIPGLTSSTNPAIATKDKNNNTITDGEGYVIFNAPDSYSEKEVVIPNVDLTPEHPKVEFLYTITNLNEAGYVQYDLINELNTSPTVTYNVNTYTYYNVSDSLDNTKSATTYADNTWEEDNLLNLPAGKTTAVKFVIEVDDPNQEAAAAGKFGFQLIYTANETREAGTVNKAAFINQTANTSAVVFDEYSSTGETYTGVTLGTGTDISVEQNGTVNLYNVGNTTYVLSHEPIMLPEDSSYMFATDTSGVGSMSVSPLATRTAKSSITLRNINTTRVKNMSNMFAGALVTELDLSAFNPVRVRNMSSMFKNCTNLTKVYIDSAWQTETVTSSKDMFAGCTKLDNYNADATDKTNAHKENGGYLSQVSAGGTLNRDVFGYYYYTYDFAKVYFDAYTSKTAEEYVVDGVNVIEGINGIDVSEKQNGSIKLYRVTQSYSSIAYVLSQSVIMFPEDSSKMFYMKVYSPDIWEEPWPLLYEIHFNNIDTSNVTNMNGMFRDVDGLKELDISMFNTINVTDMECMFYDNSGLTTIYVGDDWSTSKVTSSSSMFFRCTELPNFNSSVVDKTNAHTGTGGYLTYKAS